jgi:hypothetical protein
MRKTLIAMLGLAALAVWALPVLAGVASDPPKAQQWVPLDGRAGAIGALAKSGNYTATLSGTIVKQASATTTWFLYPGACQDRVGGTWAPKTAIQADSLDSYTAGTTGGYGATDLSLKEILWHKVTTAVASTERPTAGITGTAALWAGKYDPNWVVKVGYPNLTFQLLYIDTGAHGANYTMTMKMNQSSEQNYDFVYLIGGGGNAVDPIGNSRPKLDNLLATGADGNSILAVTWTGSIQLATPGAQIVNGTTGGVAITGAGSGNPQTVPVSISMRGVDRAVYFLFTADCLFSNEDGLWPFGAGVVYDDISCSDNGVIWAEGTAVVGSDPVSPASAGQVIQGSFGTAGFISGRVTAGAGELWQIVDGGFAGTSDNCQLQKNDVADHMFFGVEAASKKTVPGQFNSVVSCTFPVPAGTASILALWGEYLDLPRGSGYAQYSEYRYFKDATWSNWTNTAPGGGVRTSVIKQWVLDGDELAAAVQADSVQLRYNIQCIPPFAFNQVCQQVDYGILYDDLYLQVLTGVPAPVFGIFVGSVAQSTFVDGTMTGVNCATPPCWPGIRGSDVPSSPGNSNVDIHNNFNSPLGDSITVSLVTGLRRNGMGINWKQGFDRTVNEGLSIARTNASYNTAFDQPRVIYRLFDPTNKTWSPWDSSALDANNVSISAGPPADTVIIDSEYRMDWPPRDKAGLNLPGGFTINGVGAYNSLAFLPRGTRMQYYWKAVDINGGVAYQFSSDNPAREVADLPTLPGSSAIAPDIIEFDVLPGVYAPGSAGTLLAGKTNTPILNLDGSYSVWSFQQDPVTQALRGMGVRADRYRFLQGLGEGSDIGGHELTTAPDNQRPDRLSNYFPNMTEYSIRESLSTWYRIMIQSGHLRTATLEDESDARLIDEWWNSATPGTNGGDRCMFVSGDDYFNSLLNTAAADPSPRRKSMGNNVLGVNSAAGSWNGTAANLFPTVEDRFAAPGAGPGLVAGYTYPVDGGCPGPNRFDALVKMGGTDAQNAALYPLFGGVNDVGAVANMSEKDAVTDNDRSKALGYGYSIQYVRKAGVPTGAANYVHSGVQERMQILYKFLASCRGARAGAADTAKCWPCPTDANMTGNWAALTGFQTGSYGQLYSIQDNQAATGVEISDASAAPRVNRLDGNFPNPFNPQTTIKFSAAQAGKVTLRIFNVGGQLVRTLNAKAEAGANEVRWNGRRDDGTQLASGVYFYKVKFADGSESGSRMALVK